MVGGGVIPSLRVDDLGLEDLAFLKLDVKGYEERALRGAEEALLRFQPRRLLESADAQRAEGEPPPS